MALLLMHSWLRCVPASWTSLKHKLHRAAHDGLLWRPLSPRVSCPMPSAFGASTMSVCVLYLPLFPCTSLSLSPIWHCSGSVTSASPHCALQCYCSHTPADLSKNTPLIVVLSYSQGTRPFNPPMPSQEGQQRPRLLLACH